VPTSHSETNINLNKKVSSVEEIYHSRIRIASNVDATSNILSVVRMVSYTLCLSARASLVPTNYAQLQSNVILLVQ
jgi:hypothetical protein